MTDETTPADRYGAGVEKAGVRLTEADAKSWLLRAKEADHG